MEPSHFLLQAALQPKKTLIWKSLVCILPKGMHYCLKISLNTSDKGPHSQNSEYIYTIYGQQAWRSSSPQFVVSEIGAKLNITGHILNLKSNICQYSLTLVYIQFIPIPCNKSYIILPVLILCSPFLLHFNIAFLLFSPAYSTTFCKNTSFSW